MLIQACLNGSRTRHEHDAVPLSPEELARAAAQAVAAGASSVHVHPRRADGSETFEPHICDAVVSAIHRACPGIEVSLTTGAWIEPDLQRRLALFNDWTIRPELVSVNFSEQGAVEVCRQVLRQQIRIEAGLASLEDAQIFVACGIANECARVLVEVEGKDAAAAVSTAADIDHLLDETGIKLPRVHHGMGLHTWAVLDAALARGHDIRIGLEDTLELPDGSRARDNAELVQAAVRMAGQHHGVVARAA